MGKIYLVRHGKTDWNEKGLIQGLTDIELNDIGKKEIYELKKIFDISKIDICYCSPLKRAKETAKIFINNKKKIVYDKLLVERCYGNFEGKRIDDSIIRKQWDYQLNCSDENIESIKECLKRARKFLDKVQKKHPEKNLLIVSHGSFIKALHFNLIGYDSNTDFLSFNPKNGIIYEYVL